MIGMDTAVREEEWAQKGDRSALESLYRRFEPQVVGLCRAMVGADAADLAQEIFLRMCREIGGYDPSRRFKAWLFAIARNVVIDHLRRRGKWWDIERDLRPEVSSAPSDPLLRTESIERVQRALRKLPEPYRLVVVYTVWEEWTPSELAELLEVPPGRIRVQLFRALQMLEKELKDL